MQQDREVLTCSDEEVNAATVESFLANDCTCRDNSQEIIHGTSNCKMNELVRVTKTTRKITHKNLKS